MKKYTYIYFIYLGKTIYKNYKPVFRDFIRLNKKLYTYFL